METWRSEELIKEFYRTLKAAGMPRESAVRHRDKLRFFLHAYLAQEWPRDIDRADSELIRDFLGAWFVRHVGGSKSDLANYLDTFRRFYIHLYHTGRLTETEFDDVNMICANRDYFMACYDEYFHRLPDAWEDFAAGIPGRIGEPYIRRRYDRPLDRQIWILCRNLERPPAPALLDFKLFLDYFAGQSVKLTRARGHLPGRHVKKINQRFTRPEQLPPRTNQRTSRRVNWFFALAKELKLLQISENKTAVLEPRAESFLDLDIETQFAIMLDATWSRIPWAELTVSEAEGLSIWAQENRQGFAELLAELTPGREWFLDPDPGIDHNDMLLARYILLHEAVEEYILFALEELGLLSCKTLFGRDYPGFQVRSLTMNRFGRQVMRLFARAGAAPGKTRAAPLERLRESLLFY